jgi:hypothetical protein
MNNPSRILATQIGTIEPDTPDDALILAASWEERCLGVASRLRGYSCKTVILTVYDGPSKLRTDHIKQLTELLKPVGNIQRIETLHANPLANVRQTVALLENLADKKPPRITIDISTFTRKHLLQMLQGLDLAGMLQSFRIYYTESADYHTQDDEPISQGISSVRAIETFTGHNTPSHDSLLVLFLGYEGRRALALWEHLEPNETLVVIPDPPLRNEWKGRTENQNKYLLSCLPPEHVFSSDSLDPQDTEQLLNKLIGDPAYSTDKYDYTVSPLGTKPQVVGVYRFWRRRRGLFTIMYASPVRYREERATFPAGPTWLIDSEEDWHEGAFSPTSEF